MSKDKKPQCPFIQRFAEDLKLARKADRTVQAYCRAVRKLCEHLGKDPSEASEEDIRNYLLFITEAKKWSSSTVNVALQALKLYYRLTCPRDWAILKLARVKVEQKLPVVISISEVQTLLKLIEKPSMQCYFTVVYHLGLRLNEALHLQIPDIDSKRMMVHIHRDKGAKDRKIPLPEATLDVLRKYWSTHRNPRWIFPAEGRDHKQAPTAKQPMSESSVQDVIKAVLDQLNWSERGVSTHTFRQYYPCSHVRSGSRRLLERRIRCWLTTPPPTPTPPSNTPPPLRLSIQATHHLILNMLADAFGWSYTFECV